jgi:hypothetical protein
LRDVPQGLRPGDDICRLERLGVLVSDKGAVVARYAAEAVLERVHQGADATFIAPDRPAVPLIVAEVTRTSMRALEVPELASIPILVRRGGSSGPLVPEAAVYRVLLTGAEPAAADHQPYRGRGRDRRPARSIAAALYRRAVAVLRREAAP